MAVKVINREYRDLYRSDEVTDWLLGNVGDWQKAKITCEVGAEFKASFKDTIEIDSFENTITLNNGNDWGSYGFDIGDTVTLAWTFLADPENDQTFAGIRLSETFIITGLSYSVMETDADFDFGQYTLFPADRGNVRIVEVVVYSEKEFEGVSIEYSHVKNEDFDTKNLVSVIDGSISKLIKEGIDLVSLNQWTALESVDIQSGMSIRSGRIRRIANPNRSPNILGFLSTIFAYGYRLTAVFQNIIFQVTQNRIGKPLILGIGGNPPPFHQGQTNGGFWPINPIVGETYFSNGNAQQQFIFNAQLPFNQQYNIDVSFIISGTNENSVSDQIALVIYKYIGGAALVFSERIELKRWENVRNYVGQTLTYDQSRTIFANFGESYSIGLEYFNANSSNVGERYVDLNGIEARIDIPEVSDVLTFYKRYYEIEIEYMISSLFDDPTNLENRIIPDYLLGDGSLTDNFNIKFLPEWNNPNLIVNNDLEDTQRLGNTGWFDENFNQLENDFEIESVIYKDTNGNTVQSLDYLSPTIVEITVNGVQNINSDSDFGFGFMWIPQTEEDYQTLKTPFYRNTFVSNGSYGASFSVTAQPVQVVYPGAGIDGGSMDTTDIWFRNENGKLVFSAKFTPNASFSDIFSNKLEEDRKFILWLSLADGSLIARNRSNRVSLIADIGDLVKNIPPAGEYDMITRFVEHPFDENQVGVEIYSGVVQDDILARSRFNINSGQEISFRQMIFAVEMENIETGEILNLEEYSVDLSNSPLDSNGFQVFNIDESRGFNLNQGNNKNFVKVFLDENNSTSDIKSYVAFYAFKIRYEDWISKTNIPADFFDSSERENGQNNDWFDYVNTPGSDWRIKYSVYIHAEEDGEIVLFRNPYDIEFENYDQNDQVATMVRYLRDSDDSVLNVGADPETGQPLGVILSNELTRIEHDFTILDTGLWVAANAYAVTTIEIDFGGGIFEMYQISSIWPVEQNNPLRPLEGEDNLKIEIDGTQKILTSSCLVDSSLLQNSIRYRITGRVGCFDDADLIDDGGVYEPAYEQAYE